MKPSYQVKQDDQGLGDDEVLEHADIGGIDDAGLDLDAFDLAAAVKEMPEERFIRGAKTARGSMPSFASALKDAELADVYAYVKRGHTPDLDDVPMESNH